MVEAILNDTRAVVSCSVLLNGEYGYKNVTAGVPVILGKNGVEEIVQMTLGTKTRAKFKVSVESIQEGIDILEKNRFFE
jgi:malate dehydrogenase